MNFIKKYIIVITVTVTVEFSPTCLLGTYLDLAPGCDGGSPVCTTKCFIYESFTVFAHLYFTMSRYLHKSLTNGL
jgi:hypothetical protein